MHVNSGGEATIGDPPGIILGFIQAHAAWAAPVVFVLAFGESLALVSLLLPASVILFGAGGVLEASGIPLAPIWAVAALGAFLGDWVSYWLGARYRHAIARVWPLSRHPDLLPRGERFFRRWGVAGLFFGRFFGPLRSAVPLAAGVCGMRLPAFQLVNAASAMLWAAGVLAPGLFAARLLALGWPG